MNRILYIFIIFLLFQGCGKDIGAPAFLEIDRFVLEENPQSIMPQGELSHNLSDAWIYLNGDLIGVFELPCKLPLNLEGQMELIIVAGVRNNGISATKVRYPFVEQYRQTINLSRLDTVKISPKTKYFSQLNFWIEDFEDAAVKIESSIYSKTDLFKDNDPAILKYGNFYGRVDLNPTDSIWDAITSELWNIPKGRDVYIEIDYYNTNSLLTGIKAINNAGFNANIHVLLNPQELSQIVWKKIYIDIREIVGYSVNYNEFALMLTSVLSEGESSAFVCIDNIKLIHFN